MANWSPLHAQVHQKLRQTGWIPPAATLVVAVSGGQDSLCLLKLLIDLQSKWRWQLAVLHCDHRWREDSAANAEFVRALCDRWQISCQVVRAESAPRTEAEARQWRYQTLEAAAIAHHAAHVITGHTATDRAETLLYNLMRGSGADGLQALVWQRPLSPAAAHIHLVRPLLGTSRDETGAFCQAFQLPVWEDSTNCDRTYARNRIRLDLIPYLSQAFNPNLEKTLAQTAEIFSAEVDYLEQTARQLYQAVVHQQGPELQIQRRLLGQAHLAIQRRVLRQGLGLIVSGEVTFAQVEKLTALMYAPNRSQSDPFPGGAIARVEGDLIVVAEERHGEPR